MQLKTKRHWETKRLYLLLCMAARFFKIKVVKLGGCLDSIRDIVEKNKTKESPFQLKNMKTRRFLSELYWSVFAGSLRAQL